MSGQDGTPGHQPGGPGQPRHDGAPWQEGQPGARWQDGQPGVPRPSGEWHHPDGPRSQPGPPWAQPSGQWHQPGGQWHQPGGQWHQPGDQWPQPGMPWPYGAGPTPTPPPDWHPPEPPLDQPWYDAPFRGSLRRVWRKYATFSGRASRTEYWWWQLVNGGLAVVFQLCYAPASASAVFREAPDPQLLHESFLAQEVQLFRDLLTPYVVVLLVLWGSWSLVVLVPNLAITARRMHDANVSAWWLLLLLVPFGSLAVLVFTLLDPNPAGRRFDRRRTPA